MWLKKYFKNNADLSLFEFIHADDQIDMNEHATKALRKNQTTV